jgi:hypothetical protein
MESTPLSSHCTHSLKAHRHAMVTVYPRFAREEISKGSGKSSVLQFWQYEFDLNGKGPVLQPFIDLIVTLL